jgi:hypothetical protein
VKGLQIMRRAKQRSTTVGGPCQRTFDTAHSRIPPQGRAVSVHGDMCVRVLMHGYGRARYNERALATPTAQPVWTGRPALVSQALSLSSGRSSSPWSDQA